MTTGIYLGDCAGTAEARCTGYCRATEYPVTQCKSEPDTSMHPQANRKQPLIQIAHEHQQFELVDPPNL